MSLSTIVRREVRSSHGRSTSTSRPRTSDSLLNLTRFGAITSIAPHMVETLQTLDRLARSDITVTLLGETGVGKDLLARAIHAASPRARGPFVTLDCGAIPPGLIESELLGHERGAYSGATSRRPGAFERAHGGTLFLDEIGELPLCLQSSLLRLLESRCVRRVGGTTEQRMDVRIVAATNRDLEVERQEGRFRKDLYHRLAGALIRVPPLRDRMADLPLLLVDIMRDLGHARLAIGPNVLEALASHDWRGNVRELKNALAYAALFADGGILESQHLWHTAERRESDAVEMLPLGGHSLERIERAAIRQTLAQTGGCPAAAADALGIPLPVLAEKMRCYALA
ncbi:MAG: sigma 54-interacting transcriptional regulator [Polyangiaceae bacterium]|nr:sigma 54-interacting transcriptional regulator [Polyangiaceae bacterium]